MAKANQETTDLTVVQGGAVPAFLGERAAQDVGKGVSTDAADNMVPLLYVLQAQSPQCNKRGPDYVEGAEAGSIWLRNSGLPAISGEAGLRFQPCYFTKDFVEWIPRKRGGGMVGRHLTLPDDAKEVEEEAENGGGMVKKLVRQSNGNEIKETRYHMGYAILDDGRVYPYVIPLSGSGHSVSRAWMFLMNSKSLPGVNGPAPSWSALYRIKTKMRSNASGDWYVLDITDAGWVQSAEEYERGAALNKSFASGEKTYEAPAEDHQEAAPGDNAAM